MAQQGVASPYSYYGVGEVKFKGAAETRAMGGVSVFQDSIHINLDNPAGYAGLRLTTFSVGGSVNNARLNAYQQETEKAQRTTLDYISVGIPAGKKMAFGFGLVPYSSIGYKVRNQDAQGIIRKHSGSGGMNKVYGSMAYRINAKFHVGLEAAFNFGSIETIGIKYVPEVQFGTEEVNSSTLSGASFNLGAMYKSKFKGYDWYASGTYTPRTNLRFSNQRRLGLIEYVEDYTPGFIQLLNAQNSEVTVKMPGKISAGVGFGKERKWLVGTEVALTQNTGFGNRFTDITNATYENGFVYRLGGYWIPNYNAFSNYFKKVVYRAGFRYDQTGLVVNNEKIKDYAYTMGFGFPVGGTFSNINVGLEYGRKGTAKALLVEENYFNVVLSLSLNDQWFIKRRYD